MSKIEEIQKVLGDTIKIIKSQTRISPYWMLGHKLNVELTVGDINRLYYALDLAGIVLNENASNEQS